MRLWDENGKEYLDFVGGWAANSLGHCPPVLTKALRDQSRTLIHCSNAYYNVPLGKLAEAAVQKQLFSTGYFSRTAVAVSQRRVVKLAKRWVL